MLGRILAVDSIDMRGVERQLKEKGRPDWHKTRPFLSANDRSRWATVRALVEHGTYAIDDVIREPGWDTIDMVKHAAATATSLFEQAAAAGHADGRRLLADLSPHRRDAGHASLRDRPLACCCCSTCCRWSIYFWLWPRWSSAWARPIGAALFIMAAATFGTFLTTFAVAINNHVLAAAIGGRHALWAWCRDRLRRPARDARWFVLAGLFAAFTAANELPALSFLCTGGAWLVVFGPRPTLVAFLPAALVVVVAHFAHQLHRPRRAARALRRSGTTGTSTPTN